MEPELQAKKREDAVLQLLQEHVRSASHSIALIEQPDRTPKGLKKYANLNTDALFLISNHEEEATWSVDVMLVTNSRRDALIGVLLEGPSGQGGEPDGPYMTDVAERHGLEIRIAGMPQQVSMEECESKRASRSEAEIRGLIAKVEHAAGDTPTGLAKLNDITATWRPAVNTPTVCLVGLLSSVPSAILTQQLADQLRVPLLKKATTQSQPAVDAGLKSAVILDQVGHAGVAQGMQWLPRHPKTFRDAVGLCLGATTRNLDAILLVNASDEVQLVTGSFPGF